MAPMCLNQHPSDNDQLQLRCHQTNTSNSTTADPHPFTSVMPDQTDLHYLEDLVSVPFIKKFLYPVSRTKDAYISPRLLQQLSN